MYETSELLAQYLHFHYGEDATVLPWPMGPRAALRFPQRCVTEGLDLGRLPPGARALDIGCAVGGSTFELARHCARAVGIDYSHSFIAAANRLQAHGSLAYDYQETGEQRCRVSARIAPDTDRARVRFEQGDAHALPAELAGFDAVLCCNLLCRLHAPQVLLERLPALVRPGGQLFITTPESWLEAHTPRSSWLSGRSGQPPLLDTLRATLAPQFTLDAAWEMPLLIREHRRKYQWTVAQASRWTRMGDR